MIFKNLPLSILTFLLLSFISGNVSAYWVWSPESGKFVNPEGAVQDTAEEQYEYAMRFYREKNLEEAQKQIESLVKKYPGARIAPEAQYRLGVIREERGDYLKAYEAYKVVLESYPQSERFNEVIEREFKIGNLFLSGKKAKIMGVEILPALNKAAQIFGHIVKYAPYSEFGDQAQFHLGLAHRKAGNFTEAIEAFQGVIDQYPQSDFVPKARYQLAEVSYDRSTSQFRDQRALEEASTNVDRFLARYPDSEASEKAAKLRQAIDEKNAEKNYRIGIYYEKQNFLKSAIIYYEDVSKRYPDTQWGQKATDRLKALEQPAAYLMGEERNLSEEMKELEDQMRLIPKNEKEKREELQSQWEKLADKQKGLGHQKKDILKSREQDIKRRESELKMKFKKLEKKKKARRGNPSEDFQKAVERWEASLISEQEAIIEEKEQMKKWRETMGVSAPKSAWEMIPFMGEGPTEIEKIRNIEAKKLFKLSAEKQSLFEEKEKLYKQLDEINAQAPVSKKVGKSKPAEDMKMDAGAQAQHIEKTREQIAELEAELAEKKEIYEAKFGKSALEAIVSVPTQMVTASTGAVIKSIDASWSFINPFDEKEKSTPEETLQHLLELRMHLQEKIAAQKSITESLGEAFDAELALKEQKRLLTSLQTNAEAIDPKILRKEIKETEKAIRSDYQEIEDRHNHKKELLKQLDLVMKGHEENDNLLAKTGRAVTAPAVGTGKFFKAFLFGLPDQDVELTQAAGKMDANSEASAQAHELKKEIELESIVIEAKGRDIARREKELEILKAKASLAGGYKFRSAIVAVPYEFIEGAIYSAKKMVPRKDRDEVIIARLEGETQKLESYQKQLAEIESKIEEVSPTQKASAKMKSASEGMPESAKLSPDQAMLKNDLKTVQARLEVVRTQYEQEKQMLENQRLMATAGTKLDGEAKVQTSKAFQKRQDELSQDIRELSKELSELIVREGKLEAAESEILEKRINEIDHVMQKVKSRALSQDLLTERERMEQRLSQIETRRDFLSKEMQRFQFSDQAPTQAGS